jgi:preprotein translocase subunit SecG
MFAFLIVIFVLVSVLLMFVILIQSSKGGGLAGTFGGSDAIGSMFGGRGSSAFLTKVTTVLATLFLLLALLMGMTTHGSVEQGTLMEKERQKRMASPARTLPQIPGSGSESATGQPAPQPGSSK